MIDINIRGVLNGIAAGLPIMEAQGEETAALIRDAGAECSFVRSDVSSEANVKALVQTKIETYERLDCAFNIAIFSSIKYNNSGR